MGMKICIVPMRNWNKWWQKGKEVMTDLYRTYEELKPRKGDEDMDKLADLYRTYEELKHQKVEPVPNTSGICIVPMRNWNSKHLMLCRHVCIEFVSYLWGIETFPLPASFNMRYPNLYRTYEELKLYVTYWKQTRERLGFVSYLWGIETIVSKEFMIPCDSICIVPMRNWNSPKYKNFI